MRRDQPGRKLFGFQLAVAFDGQLERCGLQLLHRIDQYGGSGDRLAVDRHKAVVFPQSRRQRVGVRHHGVDVDARPVRHRTELYAGQIAAEFGAEILDRLRRDGHVEVPAVAPQGEAHRPGAGLVESALEFRVILHRGAVDREDVVARPDAGFFGGGTFFRSQLQRNQRREERPRDLFRAEGAGRLGIVDRDVADCDRFAVADHLQIDLADREKNFADEVRPGCEERFAVDSDDFIAGAQSRLIFRAARFDLHHGDFPHLRGVLRHAGIPDEAGDQQAGEDVEQRSCGRGDDPVDRFGARQFRAVGCFWGNVGGVHLRQFDVTAERQPADPVFDAVHLFLPDRPEAEGEGVDMQPPPFGGQKMAQFVRKNAEADRDENEGQ